MKKMTKGAIVTGLGVALLLGGGGTLATWNAEQSADAGVIQAGNLGMTPQPGTWTVERTGEVIPANEISGYMVVPGDVLTYSQDIDVTLDGQALQAVLTVSGNLVDSTFKSNEIQFTQPTLVNSENKNVLAEDGHLKSTMLKSTDTLTASTTFTFNADATGSQGAEYDLNSVNYLLKQIV